MLSKALRECLSALQSDLPKSQELVTLHPAYDLAQLKELDICRMALVGMYRSAIEGTMEKTRLGLVIARMDTLLYMLVTRLRQGELLEGNVYSE